MKVYITFGQIHVHSINGKTLDKDCIAVINAKDYKSGRALAFEWFEGEFHNCYTEDKITDELLSYFPQGLIEVN